MPSDQTKFKTTTLTVLGALGYLAAVVMALLNGLPWYNISIEWILAVLFTASALLGVDFGLETFLGGRRNPREPNNGE